MIGKYSISRTLVWILLGLLILGLGGFGATNFGGSQRGIGTVGNKELNFTLYARSLQNQLRAIALRTEAPVDFAQIQALGIDRQVLDQLIIQRLFDAETERLGLSLGDAHLRRSLMENPAFHGLDGEFDPSIYQLTLEQSGFSKTLYETSLREDLARSLLVDAIADGIAPSSVYAEAVLAWRGQRRSYEWAELRAQDLRTPLPAATETDLQTHYEQNLAAYMEPATREITYAWLSPDMLADAAAIEESAVQALYEARKEEFDQPERRLLEQLLFLDAEAAQAARARLDRQELNFGELVTERGLEAADAYLGAVSAQDIGTAAEAVFAAQEGDIVGPLDSANGLALFRVIGVLPARFQPLDEVRATLVEDLALENAQRVIDAQIEPISDLLAGGATLEELTQETDLQLGQLSWHEGLAQATPGANTADPITTYLAFHRAAESVQSEDFPEIAELEGGGIFALRLEGETEATAKPFDQIRAQVAADQKQAATMEALTAQGAALLPQLTSPQAFTDLGLSRQETLEITREDATDLGPPATAVFEMTKDAARVVAGADSIFVVRLVDILPPDPESTETASLRSEIEQQFITTLAGDVLEFYTQSLRTQFAVQLDQPALDAVHANFR
ncbi:MAG: SurA N-terminal domain-containing protein [Rhodobacteraceae bacterium]|nr:SurA N-terminal domain-containing protein [Paracoccaceae bacterium]